MNVLICGGGHGSFEVRGRQLGLAIGARVVHALGLEDLAWADVVVLVKRAIRDHASTVHQFGKPLVWDALDFWQQPGHNHLEEGHARLLLQTWIAKYRPTLVIGATQAMAEAAGGVYLPHHARPGLTPLKPNADVKTVAYEGTRKYLGRWGKALEAECKARGWTFVVNPQDLRYADILVALRDGEWDGWMCREWKSGVKIVNAIAAGRPIITQFSAAAKEVVPLSPTVSVIEDMSHLGAALEEWSGQSDREYAYQTGLSHAPDFSLSAIAERYRFALEVVAQKVAA